MGYGSGLGTGSISVDGKIVSPDTAGVVPVFQARIIPAEHQNNSQKESHEWLPLDVKVKNQRFSATLEAPAGGWYCLEIRVLKNNTNNNTNCNSNNIKNVSDMSSTVACLTSVAPVGIGEVFVIAGQSYAENCNDVQFRVADPKGRISAYDLAAHCWRKADDPQPVPVMSNGNMNMGSIWPPIMDNLLPLIKVPIGMVNTAVAATPSRMWLPGEKLFDNLEKSIEAVGDYRYLLWQQGESDVIENTPQCEYISRIQCIRDTLVERTRLKRPWLLAKSTYHPTVYKRPEQEKRIRDAIGMLSTVPGFLPGPDTDILGGIYRAAKRAKGGSGHFSEAGQKLAGLMWFSSIWHYINHISDEI